MKILITLITITLSFSSFAKTIYTLEAGASVSMHLLADKKLSRSFENKLSDDGVFVLNKPMIKYSMLDHSQGEYTKWTLFYARDCVNSPVYGAVFSLGSYSSSRFHAGVAFGGYVMDKREWEKRGIPPPASLIMPVIGGEVNITLLKIGSSVVNLNTYINPIIINTTLSFGFTFK